MIRRQSSWLHTESWIKFYTPSYTLVHFQISYRHLEALVNALIWFSIPHCPKLQSWAIRERRCIHSGTKRQNSSLASVHKTRKKSNLIWLYYLIITVPAHVSTSFATKFSMLISSLDLHGIKKRNDCRSAQHLCPCTLFVCFMCHPFNREKEKHMAV